MPIIPLCGDAVQQDVPRPQRAKIAASDLDQIVHLIEQRFKAVFPLLIQGIPSAPLRVLLDAVEHVVAFFGKNKLKEALTAQLGESIAPDK